MRTELNVSLSNGISNPMTARYDQTINRRDKIYTFSTIETMTNGNYFRPDNKNFPSIDSIIAPDKLFQMTTAINHPIKMIGLKKVYAKLAKTGDIDFFFTVPVQLFDSYKNRRIDLSSKLEDVDEASKYFYTHIQKAAELNEVAKAEGAIETDTIYEPEVNILDF
ncbi:10137_t:CDS:2 [Funneliformis caledonium]|uniref:10137_t:CDS:1 n=1 Tax=Funneliformis caledonium TaxID=1117310 RepID=A0A9N9HYD4_9GLOM|nr:10137_t:CDS:2 [Funneliformis caledonium]